LVRTLQPSLRTVDVRAAAPAPKRADPFYESPEWRAFVAQLVEKRGRICEDPKCDGRTHRPGMRVFADHLIELEDGGAPLDERNVMLRCGASHSKKTAEERAKRMARRF